ncbi:MAG: NAD(P)-binding protein [Bacteroidetes bacterium]|jgi:choline dehydrogenase-like flavoprotein|nr:NAD(P)-binding protein [Bacteroidota bacterium]
MTDATSYDVIIIGSGAGGGTLAYRLAGSGAHVLLLERGDFIPREADNWDPEAIFDAGKYKTKERWQDKEGRSFNPSTYYAVGGNTKVYGSALMRMREADFGAVQHHDGVSPAWPIGYDRLAPYYAEAEQLYHVHGEAGTDPTDPPRNAPFAHPPVPHDDRVERLARDLEGLGHRPFALPLGLRLNEQDDPDGPFLLRELYRVNGNESFDGYPDLTGLKADAETVCVRPALEHENVTLHPNTYVERLVTDSRGGEVKEVIAERDGERVTYRGDVVVVSCGAINSAALLLRSASDAHPDGLANGSDQVGRNYMAHNNAALLALSREPNASRFQKTLGLNDFYFGADDTDYPLGHIQMLGKSNATQLATEAPRMTPNMALDKMAAHALDFWLTTEDLPDPENRVTLDADGQIQLHYARNNTTPHEQLIQKLKSMLGALGCENRLIPCSFYLGKTIPLAGVAHQVGTCRFGTDADTSVLDVHCRTHEVDNLYVVDGSFFASNTGVNPALTIMANALRVGDHLLERLGVAG